MTTNEDQTTGQLPSKISRRTLAAGAAWSVPVIAVATAAPAYADSANIVVFSGAGCKAPGQGENCDAWDKGYILSFSVKNNHNHPITLTFSNAQISPNGPWSVFNNVVVVSAGATETVYVGVDNQSNSAQGSFSGTIDWSYPHPGFTPDPVTGTVAISVATVPPCGHPSTEIPKCPPVG